MRVVIWKAVSSKVQAEDDKISLPFQDESGRTWAERHGATVVATLTVPGYSRSESDLVTMFEDYDRAGITAYRDLRRMWYEKSFDVLWAYSFDRLGRSSTLINYVVENTITSGMKIYLEEDGGFMTTEDFRYKMAVGSIMVVSPMEAFRKKSLAAKHDKARKGFMVNGQVLYSHRAVKNEDGEVIGLALDETKTALFQDAAALLLKGVGWRDIERELFEQFGHGKNGKPYPVCWYYHLIHRPYFWGVATWQGSPQTKADGQAMSTWAYDETQPVPEGTEVYRGKAPAVYTGELAEQVIAELRRRRETMHRRSKAETVRAFTGLIMCDTCHYRMIHRQPAKGRWKYYQCTSANVTRGRSACTGYPSVSHATVQAFVTDLLEYLRDHETLPGVDNGDNRQEIARIDADRKKLEGEITRLIQKQAAASENIATLYDTEIETRSQQLRQMMARRVSLEQETARRHNALMRPALERIYAMTVEVFWNLPELEINQLLHWVMGPYRLVARDRQITGIELPTAK